MTNDLSPYAENTISLAAAAIPMDGRVLAGVAMLQDGVFRMLSRASAPSCAIVEGIPADFPRFVESLSAAVNEAVLKANAEMFSICIGYNNCGVQGTNSRGAVSLVAGSSISGKDLDNSIATAGKIELPSDRKVVQVIPVSYSVDSKRELVNPTGMEGSRLECDAHILTASKDSCESIYRAVIKTNWKLESSFYDGWASAKANLSEEDRSQVVLLIDVAESHTDVMLLRNGKPRYSAVFPFSGRQMAIEIARALNVSVSAARTLLKDHAEVAVSDGMLLSRGVEVTVPAGDGFPEATVSAGDIWDVVERCYDAFLTQVRKKLESRDLHEGIACTVLAGEAAAVKGLVGKARSILGGTARQPEHNDLLAFGDDPMLPRLKGLLMLAFETRGDKGPEKPQRSGDGLTGRVRGWLKDFLD